MIKNEKDKLIEEFSRFYDEQKAREAAEDILKGEQILRDNAAPSAGDALKAKIRLRMRHQLAQKQRSNRLWMLNKIAAAAAVIIIVFAVSIRQKGTDNIAPPAGSGGVVVASHFSDTEWAGEDIELSLLAAQIEQAEAELVTLHSNYGGGDVTELIDELETDLIETESEFWKG